MFGISSGAWADDFGRTESSFRILLLSLLAITCLVYLESINFGFINFDDPLYVTQNLRVRTGLNLENLRWAFATSDVGNWHPLVWLSYMLDQEIFGLNPAGFHGVNLVLHLANVGLLFWILRKATGETFNSYLVAALFGLHPLHCESVTWISERKDVLSTLFGLLAIAAYIRYAAFPTVWRYSVITILLALGLMSKAMLVTWPLVFLLLDFWPLQRIDFPLNITALRRLLLEKIPWCLMAVTVGIVSLRVQETVSFQTLPAYTRTVNAVVAYSRYIGKTFLPRNLAVFYPLSTRAFSRGEILAAALILISLTGLAFALYRSRRYVAVGWFWFLGTLLPVIGLVQIGAQSMADRYMYIPSIGLFVLIVWAAADLVRDSRRARFLLVCFAVVVVLPALAWATVKQNRHWRDSQSLFRHAIQVTSNNYLAHNYLGLALREEGRLEEALSNFQASLESNPGNLEAMVNMGVVLTSLGRNDEAIDLYMQAVARYPENGTLHLNLANSLVRAGRLQAAYKHYVSALASEPSSAVLHYNMGTYFELTGQLDRSLGHYLKAGDLSPDFAGICRKSIQRVRAAKARGAHH